MRESGLLVSYEQTYQYVIPQMAISVDAVNVCPSYRRPFDMIIKRAQKGRMVGAEGFEPLPSAPKEWLLKLDGLRSPSIQS